MVTRSDPVQKQTTLWTILLTLAAAAFVLVSWRTFDRWEAATPTKNSAQSHRTHRESRGSQGVTGTQSLPNPDERDGEARKDAHPVARVSSDRTSRGSTAVGFGQGDVIGFLDPITAEQRLVPTDESEAQRQTRLWREGMSAGKEQILSGQPELNREAISRRADAKFPRDFTADVLWSLGFEQGQRLVMRAK